MAIFAKIGLYDEESLINIIKVSFEYKYLISGYVTKRRDSVSIFFMCICMCVFVCGCILF